MTSLPGDINPYGNSKRKATSQQPKERAMPTRLNPDGANEGGACKHCGKPLKFWFNYKLCDTHLMVTRPAFSNPT